MILLVKPTSSIIATDFALQIIVSIIDNAIRITFDIHAIIRVLSSIRIFSSVFSHPPSVSAFYPYPRFKANITPIQPNKTTVQKMLQTLFLQHFNGFILHRTFVVYHESCRIIFLKTSFSLWRNGVFLLFCCYRQPHRLKLPGYTAESSSSDSVFWSFLQSQNKLRPSKAIHYKKSLNRTEKPQPILPRTLFINCRFWRYLSGKSNHEKSLLHEHFLRAIIIYRL